MLSSKLSVEDIADKLPNKGVVMRVDFNVPIVDGVVTDTTRIVATIPTINYVLSKGVKSVVLLSHCGRPDGKHTPKYSLNIVTPILSQLLNKNVIFLDDCVGENVEKTCQQANNGQVILLENLRFHVEEEGKGKDSDGNTVKATAEQKTKFCESLSKLGDIYVNDAFGTAHRAHSSMVGVNSSYKVAGLLMKKELQYFAQTLENPTHPFLAILGGAKVKDKIKLIFNMLDKVDMMILGGGLAFTFKKVLEGMSVGDSLYDEDGAKIVKDIINKAEQKNIQICLPTDFVCGNKFSNDADVITVNDKQGIPDGYMGLDCGPNTLIQAKQMIMQAKTIVWNGAQGVFEFPKFANGSLSVLEYVVESTQNGCVSIAGGGETVALIETAKHTSNITHVSTGGGASLELLEGNQLPGVVCLSSKE